jgi:serine/threonine protein kinase
MHPGVPLPKVWNSAFVAPPGICRSLRIAHLSGIVHRDVRPSNVMCFGGTGPSDVQLIDFGLSREISAAAERITKLSVHFKAAGPTVQQFSGDELEADVEWTIIDDFEILLAMCGAFSAVDFCGLGNYNWEGLSQDSNWEALASTAFCRAWKTFTGTS